MITIKSVDWTKVPRLPILDYVNEDFSKYPTASSQGWVDRDNDFLIGESGGLLFKMDFIFKKVDRFQRASIYFDRHAVYTIHKRGTLNYTQFWREETKRRRFGHTANCKLYKKDIEAYNTATTDEEREALLHPLRITGSHYNYLNYSRIMRTRTPEEQREFIKNSSVDIKRKKEGFARFWDFDYWNFKSDELAENNKKNNVKGKARRKGYSFKESSDSSNIVNLNPKITVLHGAYLDNYLTDEGMLTYMTKVNLDWYENNTFWVRNYISQAIASIETGYNLASEGIKKYGFMSKLISEACSKNESALVGKDAIKIKLEEMGKFPNADDVVSVTMSTLESGSEITGMLSMFGTGGTKESNWTAFEKFFFNPKLVNALPFENIHSFNGRHKVCGFFHPQIFNYEPYMDIDGNSDLEMAFKVDYVEKINKEKELKGGDYVVYLGQRANTPEEAFGQSDASIFSSPELIKHYEYIKRNIDEILYMDGMFVEEDNRIRFYNAKELKAASLKFHPYIENYPHRENQDVEGCVRKFSEPIKENGVVPENLYRITMDPVGIDKDKAGISTKHSLVSITVRAVINDSYSHSGKLMARYIGRAEERATTDKLFLYMSMYYNAKGLVETDRGETVQNITKWGKADMLLLEPNIVWSSLQSFKPSVTIGMSIGSNTRKLEGLKLALEYIYKIVGTDKNGTPIRVYHNYPDVRLMSELLKHNDVDNFDSVSDLILQAYDEKRIELTRKYKIGKNVDKSKADKSKVLKNPLKRMYYATT